MKRVKAILAVGAMIGGLSFAASGFGGGSESPPSWQKPNRCEVTKSLFVNITTGRVQRTKVAFLVSQANLQAIGAEVNMFLADEAAILAVKQIYWPKMDDDTKAALVCLQEGGSNCPKLPSLKSLRDSGAKSFGCPLCVQEVLNRYNDDYSSGERISIFDANGNVVTKVWDEVIYEGIGPITPNDFALLYDRLTIKPLCHVDASVISF